MSNSNRSAVWVFATVLAAAASATLALLWYSLSPALGPLYRLVRLGETLYLWSFTQWGRYFSSVKFGEPYSFPSIYLSSIPFGLLFAGLICILGFWAWQKTRTAHIVARMKAPELFDRQSLVSSLAARQAMKHNSAALLRHYGREPTPAPIESSMPNPLAAVIDLRNPNAISEALQPLPWTSAAIFALTAAGPSAQLSTEIASALSSKPNDAEAKIKSRAASAIAAATAATTQWPDYADSARISRLADALIKLARSAIAQHAIAPADLAWLSFADPALATKIYE